MIPDYIFRNKECAPELIFVFYFVKLVLLWFNTKLLVLFDITLNNRNGFLYLVLLLFKREISLTNMSAKEYPITDAFDSIKALSQVINPGFGYFGRLHLMPEVLGNVHIGFMNVLKLRTGFVFKSISPPNFIINF